MINLLSEYLCYLSYILLRKRINQLVLVSDEDSVYGTTLSYAVLNVELFSTLACQVRVTRY